jgi:hypothetical protein
LKVSGLLFVEGVRLWLFVFVALPYRETEARQKKAISKKQSLTPIPSKVRGR